MNEIPKIKRPLEMIENLNNNKNILVQWQKELESIKTAMGPAPSAEQNEKPDKTSTEIKKMIGEKKDAKQLISAYYDGKTKKANPSEQELLKFQKDNVEKLIAYYQNMIDQITFCIKQKPENENLTKLKQYLETIKQKNFHLIKSLKMITDLEKLEKNDFKKQLLVRGEIETKTKEIEKFKQAIDFEIKFYNSKINEINLYKLRAAADDEERQKINLDKKMAENTIKQREERLKNTLTKFAEIKQKGAIDDNFKIIKENELSYDDKIMIDIAKKTIKQFDDLSDDEKLKNKKQNEKDFKNHLKKNGDKVASNSSDLLKQTIEFRYSRGKTHKKMEKLAKKMVEIKAKNENLENLKKEIFKGQPGTDELTQQIIEIRNNLRKQEGVLENLYQQSINNENNEKIEQIKNDIKKISKEYLKTKEQLDTLRESDTPEIKKEKDKLLIFAKNIEEKLKPMIEYHTQISLAAKQSSKLLSNTENIPELKKIIEREYFVENDTIREIKEFINPQKNDGYSVSKPQKEKRSDNKNNDKKRGGRNRGRGGNRGRR